LAFALAEVLWILAGQGDSSFLNFFNSRLPHFSGKTKTYPGAYGFRLRKRFGIDQLKRAYKVLRNNPESRQVVLQLWDATTDLPDEIGRPRNADIPCNVVSMLKIRKGKLLWTQIMRSNDIQLGLPHNLVQFTFLQEVLSSWLGIEPGAYTHFADSLHFYERDWGKGVGIVPVDLPMNADRITGSMDELDPLFGLAYDLVKRAIGLKESSYNQFGNLHDECERRFPEFLGNIVKVLLAETMRRKHQSAGNDQDFLGQSNPLYNRLWKHWIEGLREE
jgi:thymidylate synthase